MSYQTSPQVAAEATKKILGCYDTITASDPRQFTAALVATLSTFPPAVVAKAADPVNGIASHVAYPNLAKMREWLDKERDEYLAHEKRIERATRKALPEPVQDPEERRRIGEQLKALADHMRSGFSPSTQP